MKSQVVKQHEIHYGEIKFFKADKNYGFITDDETQEEYFFRGDDVRMKKEEIVDFLSVSFRVKEDTDPKTGLKTKRAIVIKEMGN